MRPRHALILLLVAGCGLAIDPETSLLKPGSLVVVVGTQPVILNSTTDKSFELVDPGSRGTVGNDPGEGESPSKVRDVVITLNSGRFAGRSGKLYRSHLRPLP